MKSLFVGLLTALLSFSAFSTQYIYSTSDVAVIVKDDTTCKNKKILQMLELAGVPKDWTFLEAEILFNGQRIAACAAPVDDQVVIVDEEGQGGAIPIKAFRKLREA